MQEMQEMQVRSLGWEDALEEETAPHSSIPAGESPRTGRLAGCGLRAYTEPDTAERLTAAFTSTQGPISTLTNKTNRTLFIQSSEKKGEEKKKRRGVLNNRLLLIKGLATCGGFFLMI